MPEHRNPRSAPPGGGSLPILPRQIGHGLAEEMARDVHKGEAAPVERAVKRLRGLRFRESGNAQNLQVLTLKDREQKTSKKQ